MLKDRVRRIATLLLALAALPAAAEPWRLESADDIELHLFNMSAAEVERVAEPSCGMFADYDGHRFVQGDHVRSLGKSKKPTWESTARCSRTYCLQTPAWHWSGDTAAPGGGATRSCFVLNMASTYKYTCTRGHDPACHQRRHWFDIAPAPSGLDQEPFSPIAGQNNELQSGRYKVTLQKTGALVIADRGTSYRKAP